MSYVYVELNEYQIADKLMNDENADWTYDQARALADYLTDWAESNDEPLQFDRVAVRCDFSAYPSAIDALSEYQDTDELDKDDYQDQIAAYQILEHKHTMAIQCDDGTIIIQNT
jgi:hypothetical protein